MGVWIGEWVGSYQITKNGINPDLIEIIHGFIICGDSPTNRWMYGLVSKWVGPCQITKYRINLELIEIFM